jgi:hypothetical protein
MTDKDCPCIETPCPCGEDKCVGKDCEVCLDLSLETLNIGEFKKKIGDKADYWVEDDDTKVIFVPDVFVIVDEAKKEFPILKPLEIAKYLHDIEVWSKRWLGV